MKPEEYNQEQTESHSSLRDKLVAIAGFVILALMILSLTGVIDVFGSTEGRCIECGASIDRGAYCWQCGVHCRRCGLVTSDRTNGYCVTCYREVVYGD